MAKKKALSKASASRGSAKRPRATAHRARADTQEEKAKRFAVEAARSLADDKCSDVAVLDVRGRSQVTDFFVIGSGTSERQLSSAAQHVADLGDSSGHSLFRSNLRETRSTWVALDFVDVMVHVFMPETRLYYDLEMLWGDAPRVVWSRPAGPARGSRSKIRRVASR